MSSSFQSKAKERAQRFGSKRFGTNPNDYTFKKERDFTQQTDDSKTGVGKYEYTPPSKSYTPPTQTPEQRMAAHDPQTNLADRAIKDAEAGVRADTTVRGLNDAVNKKTDYYRNRTDMYTLGLFGDIWNMKAPEFKMSQEPEEIKTTYDTDVDFD